MVRPELLIKLCADTDPVDGPDVLLRKLNMLGPECNFSRVLTRGGWHRLGGVVDRDHRRVSDNIVQWATAESGGDPEALILEYSDSGYFATHLAGKTHYFTMPLGQGAGEFLQLEIEELQEVLDRPLVEGDWFPESIEEFLDPLDYPRVQPEPVAKAYYRFRRITSVPDLLQHSPDDSRSIRNLKRFFDDWACSSASDSGHFCHHWVLGVRETRDTDGQPLMNVKPVTVFTGSLPELPEEPDLSGSVLANAIHQYDRILGYHYAWYFIMLSRQSANHVLAESVLLDQLGAYDYLPAKDLKILRAWEERPYNV